MAEEKIVTCLSVQDPSATDRQTVEKLSSLLELAQRRVAKRVLPDPPPKESLSVLVSEPVWECLQIAPDEGYIESSQPCVDRIIRWRAGFLLRPPSLWISAVGAGEKGLQKEVGNGTEVFGKLKKVCLTWTSDE